MRVILQFNNQGRGILWVLNMGVYLNPKGISKEEWLEKYSEFKSRSFIKWSDIPDDCLPVILMDNFVFSAAGIGVDKKEYMQMSASDGRTKSIYIVKKSKLNEELEFPL